MSSTPIYTSEKVLPYVYMLTHKETGEFYIGVRLSAKMKTPPEVDINKYRTSSKYIKEIGFDMFVVEILVMFFTPTAKEDAYQHEQELIKATIDDPMSLNLGYISVNSIGIHKIHSKKTTEHVKKLSGPNPKKARPGELNGMHGKKRTTDEKIKMSAGRKGRTKGQNLESYSRVKSPQEMEKISATGKQRRCCRISDKKEMNVSNFLKYQTPHHVVYVSRLSDKRVMDVSNFIGNERKIDPAFMR